MGQKDKGEKLFVACPDVFDMRFLDKLLMLHALSGDVQYLEWTQTINERGEISMCDLLDEYWEKGLSRGFSQSIKNLMNSMKLTMEQAMEALMIPEADRQKYVDMLNANGK